MSIGSVRQRRIKMRIKLSFIVDCSEWALPLGFGLYKSGKHIRTVVIQVLCFMLWIRGVETDGKHD